MTDIVHENGKSLWHPWIDRQGMQHRLSVLKANMVTTDENNEQFQIESAEEAIQTIATNGLYTFCHDILNTEEFPYINDLLGDKRARPYLSKTAKVSALRVSTKRKSGFFIPSRTWGYDLPEKDMLETIRLVFQVFGYESTTPASLSEKVLRSTLPTKLHIHRPSEMLRRDLLENNVGGRIDIIKKDLVRVFPVVYEYDKNKAYLFHSRLVPSPYCAPVCRYRPTLSDVFSYVTGWWHCRLVCVDYVVPPIQINGIDPVHGETVDRWLWSGELADCIEAGYRITQVMYGYGWSELSNFMEAWSDRLWEAYVKAQNENEHVLWIIKNMMVGLPGRFLRQPENYKLIPRSESRAGDIPLEFHWLKEGDKIFSEWCMRAEYDRESTALSAIGSYIVAEMRRELYHVMLTEAKRGNPPIRSYVDCIAFEKPLSQSGILGSGIGQYKEKIYTNVYLEENRFIGAKTDLYGWEDEGLEVKAPGFDRERKILFLQRYQKVLRQAANE